jgi:hypothetical protein
LHVKNNDIRKGINFNDKENKKQDPKGNDPKPPIRGACRPMPYRGINRHY